MRVEVVTVPTRTSYTVGEEINLTGLTVNTYYSENGEWISHLTGINPTAAVYASQFQIYKPSTAEAGKFAVIVEFSVYDDAVGEYVTSEDYFTITVTAAQSPVLGDLDQSGAADAADAAMILVAAAAIGSQNPSGLTAEQEAAADLNGDGKIDAVDASIVLQYATYIGTGGTMSLDEFLTQL